MGFDISNEAFIRLSGAVELLFGLLIISGALPQVAVIVAGIPFNATLFFLGASELIGHLPVYGAMLVLLVYGSDPRLAHLVPWLPWTRTTTEKVLVTSDDGFRLPPNRIPDDASLPRLLAYRVPLRIGIRGDGARHRGDSRKHAPAYRG